MTGEASPFIKDAVVHDTTRRLLCTLCALKQKTQNEKRQIKETETSTWVAKGFSSSGIR